MSGESRRRFRFEADTNIAKALETDPRVAEAFRKLGLRCWRKGDEDYCVAAEKETLADAALFHEKDIEEILRELNALDVREPETPAGE